MCKIIKNEDFCYMDFGLFPYCSCKGTNKDIMKHLKFNKEGCYFIDKIFSTFNVRLLAMYLNKYELYEIDSWEELEKCGIKNSEEMHKHFIISNQYGKRFELMIPKFVCKKVDDEFEHQIKMKLSKKLFNGLTNKIVTILKTPEDGRDINDLSKEEFDSLEESFFS